MKRTRRAAVVVLACAAAVMLAGCSFGYRADDRYPYDIAVENGYAGTEGEWLSSQETPGTVYRRLYEEAVADGSFTGTYFEFLQGIAPDADATPYIQRAMLSVVSIAARFRSGTSVVSSLGAGVIYSMDKTAGDAYILTNYHVLYLSSAHALSEDITVRLYGYESAEDAISATYYGGIMDLDLAILRVKGSELLKTSDARAADIGADSSAVAGEAVYAIGNPLNKSIAVTAGVVSREEEVANVTAADDTRTIPLPEIRIDAALNHGNSGGGLFNSVGELIGIVNARDHNDDVEGFGYAIPIELAAAFAENDIANEGRPSLLDDGVKIEVVDSKGVYDETLGRVHISQKVCVADYSAGALGYLGIRQGDTLISGYVVRGGATLSETQFTHACAWEAFRFKVRLGDELHLVVSRGGDTVHLSKTLNSATYFTTDLQRS